MIALDDKSAHGVPPWLAFVIGIFTVHLIRHYHPVARLYQWVYPPKRPASLPPSKTVSASSFAASWPVTPDVCDPAGRLYGGELLKFIDVMAGVASRKHCGVRTVTISVDRVIYLSEVRMGDTLHMSVSVNRAWSTSVETGVRCMKEDERTGKISYACHAYLTFVAQPEKQEKTYFSRLFRYTPRFQVPQLEPQSLLEKKRFLLAGRRRGHRMQRSPVQSSLHERFRNYVLDIPLFKTDPVAEAAQEAQIMKLQRDLVVEAYISHSPDVHLSKDGKTIIAELEGFMEPIHVPLEEVDKAAKSTGHGAFRPLQIGREKSDLPSQQEQVHDTAHERLDVRDSLAVSMWIVRPQHTNSASKLFGGQLLLWLEQVSGMAARKVAPCVWSTATVDGMTFKESIRQGECVFIRAIVVHAWSSSLEIYALATAEGINSPPRFVADAFLTLIAMDPSTGRPLRGQLRHLVVPEGPAQELAAGAAKRREERLEDKKVLSAMYS